MWNEVYNQDKRDDIEMKLREHQSIVDSDQEREKYDKLNAEERKKAK